MAERPPILCHPAVRNRRGAAAVEFVLMLPFFFLIMFMTLDIIRVFRAQLRTEMVAVQIGQIVSQCRRITPEDFTHAEFGFWAHAERIAADRVDINSTTGGGMIISVLGRDNNQNRLRWQRRTGNASVGSVFGTMVAPTPVLRGRDGTPFVVPTGQTLFATEVFGIIERGSVGAGLIGTVLPGETRVVTFFLSRATDPTRLQQEPATPTPPNPPRDCTA